MGDILSTGKWLPIQKKRKNSLKMGTKLLHIKKCKTTFSLTDLGVKQKRSQPTENIWPCFRRMTLFTLSLTSLDWIFMIPFYLFTSYTFSGFCSIAFWRLLYNVRMYLLTYHSQSSQDIIPFHVYCKRFTSIYFHFPIHSLCCYCHTFYF